MARADFDLTDHPDRLRWNAKYSGNFTPTFAPHPLAEQALALALPPGPALDLACGPSGSALAIAATGRAVVAVDASDVGLELLREESRRRGVASLVRPVNADLKQWRPDQSVRWALVVCTGYWDRDLFAVAAAVVAPGGLIGWEALTQATRGAKRRMLARRDAEGAQRLARRRADAGQAR
jgi:SAM-dependent methyltransferase